VAVTLGEDALTFSQMEDRCNRLANGLSGWGIRRSDRVAFWTDTNIDLPAAQFAIGRIGAVFAPLNPAYSYDEARTVLHYLDPRLLVVDAGRFESGSALAAELGMPIASLGSGGPGTAVDRLAEASSAASVDLPQPDEEDIFSIFLTSGSTGQPKGVMVSQRATWLRTFAGADTTVTTGGAGQLVSFPMFHMAGWTFAYYAWSAHRPAHLLARAHGDELIHAIDRRHPGALYCIPAVWQRILDEPGQYDASSLEWALIGTSRVEPDLLRALKERFPAAGLTVSYGSTEVCRALSLAERDLFRKPYSVGLPVAGMATRVADDGELLLRSDTLMSGYFQLPDETARALDGGWYHTGDLVERDEEGYFTIAGRKRDIIRSGGEWVAPAEVEGALRGYPGVVDVAVVGLPDPEWGEVVCAVFVMTVGAPAPSVESLRRLLTGRLAAFKHPRRVMVVEELPRTAATGQLQRSLLSDQHEREGAR
jgi:acyl-CoA synthetase (AMP-forming)/AMP-acid ligase II